MDDLFRWESLREIGAHNLQYRSVVKGRMLEVELAGFPGIWIQLWRGESGAEYFCHGLTFGGKHGPGGVVSPYSGKSVTTILNCHYRMVEPENVAQADDIVVWKDPGPVETPHSAIVVEPRSLPNEDRLGYSTTLLSKNGMLPEGLTTLEDLVGVYGESYNVYRRLNHK